MRKLYLSLLFGILACGMACEKNPLSPPTVSPTSMSSVPALRLSFRYEADVPAPAVAPNQTLPQNETNLPSVQVDFDQNRPGEDLNFTFVSPDKQRVAAVYRKVEDAAGTYRLAIYSIDGKLLKNVSPNGISVSFPESLKWSPDSQSVAFVAMIRLNSPSPSPTPTPDAPVVPNLEEVNANSNVNQNTEANVNANTEPANKVSSAPEKAVMAFRTEQIYLCGRDGGDLKPLTQKEGLIYFYYLWSPDSNSLLSLATTARDWEIARYQADLRGEIFIPTGRPRIVEKTGRERLLDDNATKVHPVWSPDSAKVAVAFDKDIRIYDAVGNAPTQSAIPLRNELLNSSQVYDEFLKRKEAGENISVESLKNTNSVVNGEVKTLPDENKLVSFNPIIELNWETEKLLYLQTGYVVDLKNQSHSARSYLRWHRLILSPQAVSY